MDNGLVMGHAYTVTGVRKVKERNFESIKRTSGFKRSELRS
jgi:hypothetical protein